MDMVLHLCLYEYTMQLSQVARFRHSLKHIPVSYVCVVHLQG